MSAILQLQANAPVSAAACVRTIKVGLVGLGRVGQAVARLAPEATRLIAAGVRFRIAGALVRDVDKPRRCVIPARMTSNSTAFLRGNYDVVIEALGTVEPARGLVGRLLARGIPVVTANKALVAAHGAELSAIAARRGTTLRYEASALAGVPFLGALAARPLVSDVVEFAAVVNGTSNFILSRLDARGGTFDEAVSEAQALGLTEPDPSRDLDGLDSADKLSLLASIFGWGSIPAFRLDVQGIRGIDADDLAIARQLGGTIKPVASASSAPAGVSAFVGPAFVPSRHPLAALSGTLSGIHLSGRFVSDLFFSGPGAGPEITAATIIDDAVEAVTTAPKTPRAVTRLPRVSALTAPPATEWLVKARFPGIVPDASAVTEIFAAQHVTVSHVTDPVCNARWVRLARAARDHIDRAVTAIATTHRVECYAIRAL
jgi:homoserine dehydrogenase